MSEPTTNPADEADSEAADRLIDLGLRETLGGETPPDLSEQIFARLADSPQPQEVDTSGAASRTRRWLTYALAASVLFCLGLVARPALDSSTDLLVRSDSQPTDSRPTANQTPTAAKPAGPDVRKIDLLEPTGQNLPAGESEPASTISVPQSGPAEADESTRFIVGVGVNGDAGVVGQILVDERDFEGVPSVALSEGKQEESGESLMMDVTPRIIIDGEEPRAGAEDFASPAQDPHSIRDKKRSDVQPSEEYWRRIAESRKRLNPPTMQGPVSEQQGQSGADRSLAAVERSNRVLAANVKDRWEERYARPPIQHGFGDARAVPMPQHLVSDESLRPATRNGRETDELSFGDTPGQLNLQKSWLFEEKVQGQGPDASGDKYAPIHENPFIAAEGLQAVSTFSIDVDTASYANVRQMLNSGRLPPPDAVRLEELINYFDYDYAGPADDTPFATHVEVAGCPWNAKHRLARIGVKGRELAADKRPLSNLVFLIDVSGSMQDAEKLPLVVEGMKALTSQLGENDRVAIVVYASSEGLALPSTPGDQQDVILAALDKLAAGGSTAGGAGIQLAYQIAEDHFIEGGANRVILCTDGDFNVGTTSTGDLQRLVTEKAKQTGVFLSVCGFGRGNLNDAMMETISNQGNGNYYYIDSQREAEKVFVKGLTGTLVTIAKDVKIQVEFNPTQVAAYRLLGYENRMLAAQDFNDDKKDAGEIGAGHTVTALYELVPAGEPAATPELDELRYQRPSLPRDGKMAGELMTLKMRYKLPDEDASTKREWPVIDSRNPFGQASPDMQFASAVAGFGMLLRDSRYCGDLTWEAVREIAQPGVGADPHGYRTEFVSLVVRASQLRPTPPRADDQDEAPDASPTPGSEDSEQETGPSGE